MIPQLSVAMCQEQNSPLGGRDGILSLATLANCAVEDGQHGQQFDKRCSWLTECLGVGTC